MTCKICRANIENHPNLMGAWIYQDSWVYVDYDSPICESCDHFHTYDEILEKLTNDNEEK